MKKVLILLFSFFSILNISNADFSKDFSYVIESLPDYELENIEKRIEILEKNGNKILLEKAKDILKEEKIKRWEKIELWVNHVLDFSVLENVVWFADNVFIAEVLENKWTNSGIFPETFFKVKVLYNIKWNFSWNLDLIQDWWKWYVTEGTELLRENWVYLLATRWKNIMSNENSSKFLYSSRALKYYRSYSKNISKDMILNSEVLKDFRNAYKNENNFSNKNNYKNLDFNQKKDFEKIESWFTK